MTYELCLNEFKMKSFMKTSKGDQIIRLMPGCLEHYWRRIMYQMNAKFLCQFETRWGFDGRNFM